MSLLSGPFDGPARLRELLGGDDLIVAPGCVDPFSARVAESVGFSAVYMTGNGASAVRLGRPDVGLMTMTEMVDQAGRIVDAVDVPVIADADTGYGNPLNVIRTVGAYERAGVAALHLEDQVTPKRCGQLDGTQLVPLDEHVTKIRAAVSARNNPDTVIIGRTDAVRAEGLQPALDRARAYRAAGADALFIEGLSTIAEVEEAVDICDGTPLVYPWVEGRSDSLGLDILEGLGVRVVIFPITAILATLRTLESVYSRLKENGTSVTFLDELATFEEYSSFVGAGEAFELEARFAAPVTPSGPTDPPS
ncbi:MAG: oxaloacetate decarboxylase [Acidimicrobiales bacterium]